MCFARAVRICDDTSAPSPSIGPLRSLGTYGNGSRGYVSSNVPANVYVSCGPWRRGLCLGEVRVSVGYRSARGGRDSYQLESGVVLPIELIHFAGRERQTDRPDITEGV